MVIIRINANLKLDQAKVVAESIFDQATTGKITLPNFCELLAEVPDDEELMVFTSKQGAQNLKRKSDCETCGKVGTCYHNHGRHGVVRINCPLWRPKA